MAPRKAATATVTARKPSSKSAAKNFNGGTFAEFDKATELKAYREMLFDPPL